MVSEYCVRIKPDQYWCRYLTGEKHVFTDLVYHLATCYNTEYSTLNYCNHPLISNLTITNLKLLAI